MFKFLKVFYFKKLLINLNLKLIKYYYFKKIQYVISILYQKKQSKKLYLWQ
jgi:hypothetical protein